MKYLKIFIIFFHSESFCMSKGIKIVSIIEIYIMRIFMCQDTFIL